MIGFSPVADVLGAALGILIIGGATSFALRRSLTVTTTANLLTMGVMLIGMTVACEFVIRYYLDHRSWSTIVGNYGFWKGRLWPIALLMLTLTPSFRERWSARSQVPLPH